MASNPMVENVNNVNHSKYTFNKFERYLHNFATNNNKLLIVRSVIKEDNLLSSLQNNYYTVN